MAREPSQRYSVEVTRDSFFPGELIVLRDRVAGSWAHLLPSPGCNLVSFGTTINSRPVEAMLQPGDESPSRDPHHYGAPVLYPFPNRLRGGTATFGGRTITIDRAPGQVNASHGLVRNLPWQVADLKTEADGAIVSCTIDATGPDLVRQFPFPSRLTLTFRLTGATLRFEATARNLGDAPMPLGFGWHPYFRLPLVPGGSRETALVQVPARQQWELDDTLVPTGETRPVPPDRDFTEPKPLGALALDDVYTDVRHTGGSSVCALSDAEGRVTLRVAAGPTFREWVVYAPPVRPTICFEPYTCPTDALNLAARGLDAGVISLDSGATWTDWISLELAGAE